MSSYSMPPDTSAKEKLVGGLLDLGQLLFLLGGLAIGLAIGFLFKTFAGMPGLVVGLIPGIILGLVFGFVKIKGLSLLQYIRLKKKHKLKTKKLPNVRLKALTQEEITNIRNF